jgi:hypothetical protein
MSGLLLNPMEKLVKDRCGAYTLAFSSWLKYLKGFKIKNYTLS